MPTVFITNMGPTHDYSKASAWGVIRPVTQGNFPVFKTDRLILEISESLISSTADDFLLFSGSSVIAGLTLSLWLSIHPHCHALLYDRSARAYVLRTITKESLLSTLEYAHARAEERSA